MNTHDPALASADASVMRPTPGALRRILRLAPQPVRWRWHRLRHRGAVVRRIGPWGWVRWTAIELLSTAKAACARRHHRVLSAAELRACRRSDTVFVFGSGYSLTDLTPGEWEHFTGHDTFGFSGFIYQNWVRADFHLIRGWKRI